MAKWLWCMLLLPMLASAQAIKRDTVQIVEYAEWDSTAKPGTKVNAVRLFMGKGDTLFALLSTGDTVAIAPMRATAGGASDGQDADSIKGKKINSAPSVNGTVPTYYLTGDSVGWAAPSVDSARAAGKADTLNGDDYVTRVEGVESGTGQEKYLLGGSGGFAAVDKVTFRGSFITIATGSGNPYTVSVSGVGVIYVTVHYSITSDADGSMTVDIKFDGIAAAVPQTFAGLKTHPTASAMTAVISYDHPATPDLELVGSAGVTITDVQWSVLIFPTEP
jgi:hypothetical protein